MGFIHPRWWSPFLCWGHQQKDIFKSSWWDDSPLLRFGHHGLSDGVRSLVGGEVVPCKQTLSSQCLYLSWKVVVLHTLFLVDIPKKGKGIHFDVWFFKPQTNIWKSSSWSSSPRSTRIYNAYTYLSVNEWHPASSREFADVAYHPRGGLLHDGYSGSAWPSWHVWGAAGDRGTKQCSCNRGKHSWSWICKQFNSRI